MEHILNEYCRETNAGLLLLSMPTGFGKTYNVLNFIYSNYKEFAQQNRKIIFITNLKKNLPINELKNRFIADGNKNEFENHVLFIDSNVETVINNLLAIDHQIHDQFKTENYNNLKSCIEILKNNQLPKIVKDRIKTEIRQDIEPKFRGSIQKELNDKLTTKKSRLLAIKNDKNYQWIGKLYPAVFTDEKTVFFLSMDKFVAKNTTLIEPSYYFSERFIDKALIFIDEFDTTKEAVLNNIIKSGLRHKIDLLDLFLNIHNHLMQNECPELLIKESEWLNKKSSGKNWLSPRQKIESFKQKANDIFNTYKLQHTCKSHDEFSTKKRNFLFYDYQFHNVMDRHQRIEIIQDLQNLTNWIKGCDTKNKKTGVDIHQLLNKITGFLTYFQTGIKYLADNYRHLKEEDQRIQETFTLEFAVKTVLNNFRLDDTDVEFLTSKILEDDFAYNYPTDKGTIQRQGFYDTGFRYHDIVDSDEHDTLSKIYMFNFSRTPESFLAGVCSKAMVVGISATAGLYTNIGNYDLEYLKSRLGNSFIHLKDDDIIQLNDAYSEATEGYDKIKIKPSFIGTNSQEEAIKQLEELLNDREVAESLWNEVCDQITDDKENSIKFLFCRYVRALTAWKYFLDHPDCHAFLCLFSKLPKPSDPKFNLNILSKYANYLLYGREAVINGSVEDTIFLLSGDNFAEKKEQLLNELKDNKRRFIISAYQTIGVGQNIQFPIPSELEPIHINKFRKDSNMDINGIYLDNPTNLLVNIYGDKLEDDNFIKYIFQLEFLRENGAMSLNTFKSKLDAGFHRYIGKYPPKRQAEDLIKLHNTDAYSRFFNKIIIQALGRICRTNMKAPIIHILADASIKKHLNRFYLPKDIIPVREYTALLELVADSTNQSEDLIKAQNLASHRSNQTSTYIRRKLNLPWTGTSVKEWQDLREQVLRQPAIAQESECNDNWNIIYVKLPQPASSYVYSEINDLVIDLKESLRPYITNEKLITDGKCEKQGALNFRIIHDADFYEQKKQKDEYLSSTDKLQIQNLTIESSRNISKPIVKTIIKEQLIKRDISAGKLKLFEWDKLQLNGVWTFAAWDEDENDEDENHVIFMEIQPNGDFEFNQIKGLDIFNWQKFQEYHNSMTDSSSGDKLRNLEGLVISDTKDINQIFRTDEITIPDLVRIETILKEVETELPENLRSGNALADIVEEFLQAESQLDIEKFKSFSSELRKVGREPISKADFKSLIAQYLGTKKKVGDKYIDVSRTREATNFRDYLLEKHQIRLKFPQDNQSKDDLFDASLNIKYFGETKKEAYYFVGDRREKVQFSFKDACHLRKIVAVDDSKLIFTQLLPTMDVDFVRTGQSTVIPFPFKYIREYQNFGVAQ